MSDWGPIVTIVSVVCALFGGLFGQKLLDRWFDRDKTNAESSGQRETREFADNEQARRWLQEQLKARDADLHTLRDNETKLLTRVGDLAERLGRFEERANAQAKEISALQDGVGKLGADYQEMKAERDAYREAKHDADNKLTAAILGRERAERELKARDAEIERLRGQMDAIRPIQGGEEPSSPTQKG